MRKTLAHVFCKTDIVLAGIRLTMEKIDVVHVISLLEMACQPAFVPHTRELRRASAIARFAGDGGWWTIQDLNL